jgi:hypothetical protein
MYRIKQDKQRSIGSQRWLLIVNLVVSGYSLPGKYNRQGIKNSRSEYGEYLLPP